MKKRIAIVDGVRTPFCKAGGVFNGYSADDLGATVLSELLDRTGIEHDLIDEVIFGNVAQPSHAANIARVIALKAGLPDHIPAQTVHRNCASGMQSITTGAMQILSGRSSVVIAGGTESMSQIPLLVGKKMTKFFVQMMMAKRMGQKMAALASFRPSFLAPVIGLKLGLHDPVCDMNMGETAEKLARKFTISREEQDEFACTSHQKMEQALDEGRLAEEILPVVVPPKYAAVQSEDNGLRRGQTAEQLAKLRPYFKREAGTVTVGNSCPITDGACALLLMSEEKAKELGKEPLGWLDSWAYAAMDGSCMGLGPVYATAKLLKETGGSMKDFDVVEMNEAFAAQVIANERAFASKTFAQEELGQDAAVGELNRDTLNVNGGAIAMGHPVGATGTRLVLTVLHELKRRNQNRGLATLCIGGGQGAALALEAA